MTPSTGAPQHSPVLLRRSAVSGLRWGLPVAAAGTVVTLFLQEDAAVVVWGTAMILGPVLVLVALVLHLLTLGLERHTARSFPLAAQAPSAVMTRPQRVALLLGIPLVLLFLLLSVALLLRGETLF